MARPFRFGVQLAHATSRAEWVATARKAEAMGFSTLFVPDHLDEQLGPIAAVAVAAEATTDIRVGTLVLANDFRHPAVVAKEAATLDLLSDGRLELGLGTGWMRSDYEAAGIASEPARHRVERFAEAVAIVKGLLSNERFSFSGRWYTVRDMPGYPTALQKPHPPILIGGGGQRMLSIAAREADIVGINPVLASGVLERDATLDAARLRQKVDLIVEAAGDRADDIELNVLVSFALVTDERHATAEAMGRAFGVTAHEAMQSSFMVIGSIDQIVDDLQERREELGISYVVFAEGWQDVAPVVDRLAGT